VEIVKRILVIDDEPDVGRLIAAAADGMGFQCMHTTDPAAFLREIQSLTTLVFLDLMMPQIDVIELLRLLAQQQCKVPIVLMSGVGNRILETAEQFATSLGLCIAGHLNKPFRLRELQEIVGRNVKPQPLTVAAKTIRPEIPDGDLRQAVERDEFVVFYQPQIDLATGAVEGLEALVRWQHPKRGLIFPDQFISRAGELGLIDQLGWIVFEHGIRELAQFADGMGTRLNLSLNVSADSLQDLHFPEKLLALLGRHGISPDRITVEITESVVIEELSNALDVLTRLRLKGVLLSIDDFGTGFAMMRQLRNVPATELKIDKSLVQNIHRGNGDRIVVQKIIEIGHELGLKVVGEGVETEEQLSFLASNRCDCLQGYLYSRPIPAQQITKWLVQYRSQLAEQAVEVQCT
jgi:EAL domain-containing protein (putative c-di-GMP-specific phosphodiesterase class I)